jgi:phage terminase large subunit
MATERAKVPPKLLPVFAPARGDLRYRGAYGGRGSGKSRTFAMIAAVFGYCEPLRILCVRELQSSIKESFYAEIKEAIASISWLAAAYDVGENYIRGYNGTEFLFKGLRHNISSVKSTANIDICIIEEAEDVPEYAWIDLEPTIRAPKSEIWVIWNRKIDGSPVDERFIKNCPPRAAIAGNKLLR